MPYRVGRGADGEKVMGRRQGVKKRKIMFFRTSSKMEKTYLLMEEIQSTGNVSFLVVYKACFHSFCCSGEVFHKVALTLPTTASSVSTSIAQRSLRSSHSSAHSTGSFFNP